MILLECADAVLDLIEPDGKVGGHFFDFERRDRTGLAVVLDVFGVVAVLSQLVAVTFEAVDAHPLRSRAMQKDDGRKRSCAARNAMEFLGGFSIGLEFIARPSGGGRRYLEHGDDERNGCDELTHRVSLPIASKDCHL